jgi:Methyltransferase domain
MAGRFGDGLTLDVAPAAFMSNIIRAASPGGYLSIDFAPEADRRVVDITASLTDLPLANDTVSVIVCFHVLEHVPDDRRAMREIARVLRPDGIALVQVPWRPGETDEDPSASAEERLRRFGQADHVRYYGSDFVARLEEAGLCVTVLAPGDVMSDEFMAVTGTRGDEYVWLCTRVGGPETSLARVRDDLLRGAGPMLRRVAGHIIEARGQLESIEARAAEARRQLETKQARTVVSRDRVVWAAVYARQRRRAKSAARRAASRTKRVFRGR